MSNIHMLKFYLVGVVISFISNRILKVILLNLPKEVNEVRKEQWYLKPSGIMTELYKITIVMIIIILFCIMTIPFVAIVSAITYWIFSLLP